MISIIARVAMVGCRAKARSAFIVAFSTIIFPLMLITSRQALIFKVSIIPFLFNVTLIAHGSIKSKACTSCYKDISHYYKYLQASLILCLTSHSTLGYWNTFTLLMTPIKPPPIVMVGPL